MVVTADGRKHPFWKSIFSKSEPICNNVGIESDNKLTRNVKSLKIHVKSQGHIHDTFFKRGR